MKNSTIFYENSWLYLRLASNKLELCASNEVYKNLNEWLTYNYTIESNWSKLISKIGYYFKQTWYIYSNNKSLLVWFYSYYFKCFKTLMIVSQNLLGLNAVFKLALDFPYFLKKLKIYLVISSVVIQDISIIIYKNSN